MRLDVDEVRRALERDAPQTEFAGQAVTVVVPDATRPWPSSALDAVLTHLAAARVRILVGLGLHRPMTDAELAPIRASADRSGAEWAQHDPDGLPAGLEVHPWLIETDAVFALGVVEPHQYAGYSGGTKALTIGCGARRTIDRLHGLELLRNPSVRIGRRKGNAFRAALREGAKGAAPAWGLQLSREDGRWRPWAGPLERAWEKAARAAETTSFRAVSPVDWLLLPVPPDKAGSFYQALRAASYVALTDRPAIRRGGWLFVEAECPEGLGRGSGERAFAEALARGREAVARELSGVEAVTRAGGAQRAYILELTLARARVGIVGASPEASLEAWGVRFFPTRSRALEALEIGVSGMIWNNVFSVVPVAETSMQL